MTELPRDVWRIDYIMRIDPSQLIVFATTRSGERVRLYEEAFDRTHVFVRGGDA